MNADDVRVVSMAYKSHMRRQGQELEDPAAICYVNGLIDWLITYAAVNEGWGDDRKGEPFQSDLEADARVDDGQEDGNDGDQAEDQGSGRAQCCRDRKDG